MSGSGDDFGGEDPYAPNTASGINEDDFAAPHYELDDETMAPATGLNESDDECQSADVTLVRVFLGSTFKGASESSFLTLRCPPGASVLSVKIQAMNKLKNRFPTGGNFDPSSYVLMSVPMPGLPQKRTQGGSKGECSDRDLALPAFVPFLEHFDSALVSEMQGHKVMYMRLEPRDKSSETPAKEAKVAPLPSGPTAPSKVRLVRVAFREVDNGVTPGQGFLTLKCTDDTTARQIKAQALSKYNAKRVGGSPKTHSRSSQDHEAEEADLENYTLSLIAAPKSHSRTDSKTSDSGLGKSKSESLIRDDEKMGLRFPKTAGASPQVLEVLLSRRTMESSLSRSRTSTQREDSLRSAREDSIKRGSGVQDDALMRYVFAATPSEEAGVREDSTNRDEEPQGDYVLLRVKFQAFGGFGEGFVTIKCEESASVTAIKEQAIVKFTRRSNSGTMPTAKLDSNLFTLWRMEPTAISDENINGGAVTFWKLFKIQKASGNVQVQMVFSGSRKEEAVTHGSLDTFSELPNAQVFIRHGLEEKGQQIQVWYGLIGGGRLGWGKKVAESVLLSDVKEVYLGSHWFPELFASSSHARRCFALEWSDSRGPGWLLLEAASSDALRTWIDGLYGLLMKKSGEQSSGQSHKQCTLYHPVVKPK